MLASGGDSRQRIDPSTGRNKYGCRYEPEPQVLTFGSCTASTISPTGYAAAERVAGWLRSIDDRYLTDAADDLHETIRHRVLSLLVDRRQSGVDVVLTPSGTDAELMVLELFARCSERPIENVIVGPAEVGSGTSAAAAAMHFDETLPNGGIGVPSTPVDAALAERTTVRRVGMRDRDGSERRDDDIDDEVRDLVGAAIGRGARVLIHVVAHSKTGVHAPSLATVDELVRQYGRDVAVVIDAAQGRFSRRGLNESLRAGRMVIVTGSKFFGGPPFAGAVLVPPEWIPPADHRVPEGFGDYFTASQMPTDWIGVRAALPAEPNIGLLLRWHASTAEMQNYYTVPSRLRLEVLRAFESMVPEIWATSDRVRINAVSPPLLENETERLLESKTTVFPFSVSTPDRTLGAADLSRLYGWMRDDVAALVPHADSAAARVLATPIQIGQPVRLSSAEDGPAVLRVAISGSRITATSVGRAFGPSFDDRLASLRNDVWTTLAKLDLLATNFELLAATT